MSASFAPSYSFPGDIDDQALIDSLGLSPIVMRDHVQKRDVTFKAPQVLACHFAKTHRKFILSFDKGMGKTLTYLRIAQDSEVDRIIILCTKNAMSTQRSHIRRFFPQWADSFIFVQGQKTQRQKAWNSNVKVFITTYAAFQADLGLRSTSTSRIAPIWTSSPEMVIADEYHRVLRNRSSGIFKLMKGLNIGRLILSSGSAANKGPHSMWAALHICESKLFTSYWKYVNTFCIVENIGFGQTVVGVKNIEGWRRTIGAYCIHRKKDLKDYPLKTRQSLEVEMEPWQKKIHDQLRKQLLTVLDSGDLLIAPNVLAATIKIRQLMVCPKYLDPSLGYGAGLDAILEDAQTSELTHFVVSTPFTGPIPHIRDFFSKHGFGNIQSLQGGMGPDEIDEATAKWTRDGGPIIQSIQFAESYELPAAHIMYMLGYEHDPERNSQAEDRIHRDISVTPHPVDIYYLKHIDSYDVNIIEAMSISADNVHALMNMPIQKVFNL